MIRKSSSILLYPQLEEYDQPIVGKTLLKHAQIAQAGFPLPEGFIIPSSVYFAFLHENKLTERINQLLKTVNFEELASVEQVAAHIQKCIRQAPVSDELMMELNNAYTKLGGVLSHATVIARAYPTSEDLFSKEHEVSPVSTITGEANLVLHIKDVWANLFAPAALLFRQQHKIDHFRVGIALGIERKLEPSMTGTLTTFDPMTHDKSIICIEAKDATYHIQKKTYEVIHEQKTKRSLSPTQLSALAKLGEKLEAYTFFPQQLRWAFEKNTLYLLDTKAAVTTNPQAIKEESHLAKKLRLLVQGKPLFPGIVTGRALKITTKEEIGKVHHGDIVITTSLTKDLLPALKKAAGFVCEETGLSPHIFRELGIPGIQEKGLAVLTKSAIITLDGAKGAVYKGTPQTPHNIPTATKLFVALSDLHDIDDVDEAQVEGILITPTTVSHIQTAELSEQLVACTKKAVGKSVLYCFANDPSSVLGFHGTYQLLHEQKAFLLQVQAIKSLYETGQGRNLAMVLPYVRTVNELRTATRLMAEHGVHRGPHAKLWMTVSLPANVLLLAEFIATGIDGLVIDVPTLTTLVLGTDKDDSHIANTFDPSNAAVLAAIEQTIKTAHQHRIPVILSGSEISLHKKLLESSIRWGITTIATSLETVDETKKHIAEYERMLIEKK